jgi:cysteine-rich repeat protein
VLQPPELCDLGDQNGEWAPDGGDTCSLECDGDGPHCGDELQNGTEACDDGNFVGHDACTNACTAQACGDDVITPGELCYADSVEIGSWVDLAAVAAADLNADENIDLVVADRAANQVAVLLGDGTGSFAPAVGFDAQPNPRLLRLGLFDANASLDVVTLGEFDAGFEVMLGDGAGGLDAGLVQTLDVIGLGAGDLNGDTTHDLVLGTPTGNAVYLADGDGTFSEHSTHEVDGHDGDAISLAFLDGDAHLDAVVLLDAEGESPPGLVRTMLGDGSGSLSTLDTFDLEDDGDNLLAADVNDDQLTDIAVLRGSQECFSENGCAAHPTLGEVNVYTGNGDGTLEDPDSYVNGMNPAAIVTGDLDADGDLDLLVAYDSFLFATFLSNDGNGAFEQSTPFRTGFSVSGLATADFDEDGVLDIAVTLAGDDVVPGGLEVYLSNP